MKLVITHITQFNYVPQVAQAWHATQLCPRDTPRQRVLSHSLRISPTPHHQRSQTDGFGNHPSYFSISQSHAGLLLQAHSNVHTLDAPEPVSVFANSPPALTPWERARDSFQYQRGATFDDAVQFRFDSPGIPTDPAFLAYAAPSFTPKRSLGQAAIDLMHRIHADFRYEPFQTDASTPPLEALHAKVGVCQDFAQVLVACLRALGLCARYVSGYLLTEPPPGCTRLIGADASHAWGSVYLPDLAQIGNGIWLDLDPTNDRCGESSPGPDYVTLAWGRDYADVAPLRGVIQGGSQQQQTVCVTVAPEGTFSNDQTDVIAPPESLPSQTQIQNQSQSQSEGGQSAPLPPLNFAPMQAMEPMGAASPFPAPLARPSFPSKP